MEMLLIRRWCRDAMNVAVTCVVVLAVVIVAALFVFPRTGTAQTFSVLTGSMSPAIPAGSLVFVQPVDPRRVNVGDVITFRARANPEALVTHRVVGFVFGTEARLSFRTRGDANGGEDPDLVPGSAVVGRVVHHLPLLGHLSRPSAKIGLALVVGISIPLLWGGSDRVPRRRGQRSADPEVPRRDGKGEEIADLAMTYEPYPDPAAGKNRESDSCPQLVGGGIRHG